jgi:hypothetical protein
VAGEVVCLRCSLHQLRVSVLLSTKNHDGGYASDCKPPKVGIPQYLPLGFLAFEGAMVCRTSYGGVL